VNFDDKFTKNLFFKAFQHELLVKALQNFNQIRPRFNELD
jgi:hypothetical protein